MSLLWFCSVVKERNIVLMNNEFTFILECGYRKKYCFNKQLVYLCFVVWLFIEVLF